MAVDDPDDVVTSEHVPADAAASEPPVDPGSPSLENALFVLLGIAVAIAVVLRLAQLFG